MSDVVDTHIAAERVQLFADRALYWPRENSLLIADLHLGKGDTFRSAGIPLPSGGTRHDLERLARLLARTQATRLIVLGDMLHSDATEHRWRGEWEAWRELHRDVCVDVVAGNHDRALQQAMLEVRIHPTQLVLDPFVLRHAPRANVSHVVCGHIHPVIRIPNVLRRWPAFVLTAEQTILPAFSAFTGGALIDPSQGRFAVCHRDGSDIAWVNVTR